MKTNSTASPAHDEVEDELEICISCLKTNPPETNFCRHCGTPLTSYAATGPFESIFAEGDFWRKVMRRAKGKPVRHALLFLVLVAMVLSFLFGVLLPR